MTAVLLSENWDACCVARIGVARLTRMAFEGQDLQPLWDVLMDKATDDAAGSGMGMDLSIISQLLGDKETGLAIQADTLALNQLYRSPCTAPQPRLRVLAFAAATDIGGNTPLEFLLADSDIELATFYVVPGQPLPRPMPDHDVAIVVAPGGAAAAATLEEIAALASHWPRPILNLPRAIANLERDRLYQMLQGIKGLEIPQTALVCRAALSALGAGELPLKEILGDGVFPVIVRPTGSHAGFGLAKIDDGASLAAYLAQRPEAEFFLSRFVDYASPDGLFRKYRLTIVDGKAYACHMAIAEEWKVWYLNADMALSVPHRTEEALFMQGFDQDFAVRHAHALGEMSARIGLDYVIVDCAQTVAGELLIFEADNCAIVHDMDPPNVYPYKPAQMRNIFQAVQAMLVRRAGRVMNGRPLTSAA